MPKPLSRTSVKPCHGHVANFIVPARHHVSFWDGRRNTAIVRLLTRIVCLLLVGLSLILVSALVFAAPPHKEDRVGSLRLGLAALKNGDVDAALRQFQPLADKGDGSAQFALAMIHAAAPDKMRHSNPDLSHKLMAMAAAQGHLEAQFQVGLQYFRGFGVAADMKKARLFLTLAAHRHHLAAQHNLAVLLSARTAGYKTSPRALMIAHKWALIAQQNAATTRRPQVTSLRLAALVRQIRAQISHKEAVRSAAAARRFRGTAI